MRKMMFLALFLSLPPLSCGPVIIDNGCIFPKSGHSFFRDRKPNTMYLFPEFEYRKSRICSQPSQEIGLKCEFLTDDAYGELPGSFSDDGKRVSFVYGESKHNPEHLRGTLWIKNLKTGRARRITENDSVQVYYLHDWCDKTNKIVFTGYYMNGKRKSGNLYQVDLETKEIERLTDLKGNVDAMFPMWSYDGKYIAFAASRRGKVEFDLYLMDYETREIRKLTDTKDHLEIFPMWKEGGRYLYYYRLRKQTNPVLRFLRNIPFREKSLCRIDLSKEDKRTEVVFSHKALVDKGIYNEYGELLSAAYDPEIPEKKYVYHLLSDYPFMSGKGDVILTTSSINHSIIFPDVLVKFNLIHEPYLPGNGCSKLSPTGDKLMYASYRKKYNANTKGTSDLWIVDFSEFKRKFLNKEWEDLRETYYWRGVDRKCIHIDDL